MAILTGYPGLEVTVEVDGQRAQEYDAPADEVEARATEINLHLIPQLRLQGSPYTIKYIESKPGKPFVFELDSTSFSIPSPDGKKHLVAYKCFLDGISTGYYRLVGGTKERKDSYNSGSNESGWQRHKFQFSTFELVEGGDQTQAQAAKEYGTLLVKLYHTIDLCRTRPKTARDGPVHIQSVSEEALKGRSVDSKVHFNSELLSGPLTAHKFEHVDPDKRPFAIFEFRYRTMEGLMSEGVVPRPANEDDQVIDLKKEHQPLTDVKPDPENTRGIKPDPENTRGIKPDSENTRGIKPEPENTRGVKRERPMDPTPLAVCYKLRRLESGKVEIDLTED